MTPELEQKLYAAYPEIFFGKRRGGRPTAVEYGIECGDGWFNILYQLCHQIQWHITESRKQRAHDLRFNRALFRAGRGNREPLIRFHTYGDSEAARERAVARVEELFANPDHPPYFRTPAEVCPNVVAAQVKEKMGTLRFYIDGGDDVVRGMIGLAVGMSAVTCEICGNPGQVRGGPWIRTLCDDHDKNDSQAKSS